MKARSYASKTRYFALKNDELCIENDGFCIEGGDDREHKIVKERFDDLMDLDWHRQKLDFKFDFIKGVFQGQIPNMFQFWQRFYYAVRQGGTDEE